MSVFNIILYLLVDIYLKKGVRIHTQIYEIITEYKKLIIIYHKIFEINIIFYKYLVI